MTTNEKYAIFCFIHNSIFCAAWFTYRGWFGLIVFIAAFYAVLGTAFLLRDYFSTESKSQRELKKELRMRIAQLVSGDYKACGHTSEEMTNEIIRLFNMLK